MSRSPPLRFLVLILAGWAGSRAAWLAPEWWALPAEAGGTARPGSPTARHGGPPVDARAVPPPLRTAAAPGVKAAPRLAPRPSAAPDRTLAAADSEPGLQSLEWTLAPRKGIDRRRGAPVDSRVAASAESAESRWSFAAWSFLRQGEGRSLVPGGLLGGSQAGAVARFRLNDDPARPLALALRLSSPIRRPAGAEAAAGIDWQPSRRLPLHILAERRQRLGREGRSAFALALHGGVSDTSIAGLRMDAYAQAGIVGARSRDLFGDGALRLSVPAGRLAVGAGIWAAAQPGVARLDLGPQASFRLPLERRNVVVAADWRFRVAGHASPGSGPTLTIGTDF